MAEENEVLEQVSKEVEKIGALAKENIDTLRKNYTELQHELKSQGEKVDMLGKLKLDRLADDISKRQEEVDKKNAEIVAANEAMQKHMEQLDMMIQRQKMHGVAGTDESQREVRDFVLALNARSNKNIKADQVLAEVEKMAGVMPEYKQAFEALIRINGDAQDLTPEQRKTLSVGSDPDGGYTVTPAMSSRVITKLFEMSPIRSLAGGESISTDALEMMTDIDDSTTCGWAGSETVLGNPTATPKLAKLRIPVHQLYARVYATQQLLEDSGINIESWLGNKIGDKMARTEASAFVTGTGIGQPRGFLTYGTGSAWGTIEQVAMGDASLLTADGFVSLKYALIEQYMERATWLMNRSTVAAAMKLKTSTGGDYVWKPGMLADDPTSTILGLPVRMATDMPAVAANALAVAIAEWREAYLIVDRLGITLQRDPYSAKPLVEFYSRKRLGADVVNFQAIKIGKIAAS